MAVRSLPSSAGGRPPASSHDVAQGHS
jgi:hypothetical protein